MDHFSAPAITRCVNELERHLDLHTHTIISANSVTAQAEWRLQEDGAVRLLHLLSYQVAAGGIRDRAYANQEIHQRQE